jgi:radical SAM superfamily enzyme
MQAAQLPEIVALSIATRPDCLGPEALDMLGRLSGKKPLWVELGLQTINEDSAKRLNRCYSLPVYEQAMRDLQMLGVHRITHVILGLPGENREDMLITVRKRESGRWDKLQLLHVLEGTCAGG